MNTENTNNYAVYKPPLIPLEYLYIDEHIMALNKPAGLLSVPGRGEDKQDCLATRVNADHPGSLIVHRLDMSTSGVILLARSAQVQSALGRMFETRQVDKKYTALVHGNLTTSGEVDFPLACDWPNRPRQKVDPKNGKPAQTYYDVISHDESSNTTRVTLVPLTGRTHQLRVHMSEIGHPVVGDELYNSAGTAAARLMLHSTIISLKHPVTGRHLEIRSPVPF